MPINVKRLYTKDGNEVRGEDYEAAQCRYEWMREMLEGSTNGFSSGKGVMEHLLELR